MTKIIFVIATTAHFANAQNWVPTVADPTYRWNNRFNWSPRIVPTSASTVTIADLTLCTLDVNVTVACLIFSGNLDLNGKSLTVNGNNVQSSFSFGRVTNSGSTSTLFVTSTTGSGTTIINNSSYFGPSVNVNLNTDGATVTTVSGATFNGTVSLRSPDIFLDNTKFNGTGANKVTITKTGFGSNMWAGGNVYQSDATIINEGTGPLIFSVPGRDLFKGNLTLTENIAGTLLGCVDCELDGNLTVNSPSTTTFKLGKVQFVGNAAQVLGTGTSTFNTIGFSEIDFSKSSGTTVALAPPIVQIDVSNSATFNGGIFTGNVNFHGAVAGGNNGSFVSGKAMRDIFAFGPATFPVGDRNAGVYRPITISPSANGFACRYIKALPPNAASVKSPLTNVSKCEYWSVEYPGSATPSITVKLSWVGSDCGNPSYVSNLADLRVAYLNNANKWQNEGQTVVTGAPNAGTITSSFDNYNVPGSWTYLFTLASVNGTNALPVELREFSGKPIPQGVRLHWNTASELNNDIFEIERARNGTDFEKIGTVDGHGTTTAPHEYSWLDPGPLSGLSYYRLRQVDFDGGSTYSKVISVSNFPDQDQNEFLIYPIPVRDKLFLSVKADIRIVDMLGNVIFTGNEVDEINVEALVPGGYCLVRKSTGQALRFVKN
ncbi:MAG TPA: hypothetical protein VL728_10785 [Cyclobacteriaceae bacterium]|nr:hypothetical protein [Cyclobacteriaceae bacterium]